ncbi:MAG: hypothetical protein ACHREM_14220 [Polyangiales bacterium]
MTIAILDPWIVASPAEDAAEALTAAFNSVRRFGLSFAPVASHAIAEVRGRPGRIRAFVTNSLVSYEPPQSLSTAGLRDHSAPADVTPEWRAALDASIASSRDWRSPILVTPSCSSDRAQSWPGTNECVVKTTSGIEHEALHLRVDAIEDHEHFIRDRDPWVLQPRPNAIARRTEYRLPRPTVLDSVPMHLWIDRLESLDWTCGQDNRRYYIPPEEWTPSAMGMPQPLLKV